MKIEVPDMEGDDEDLGARDHWLRHPHTESMRGALRKGVKSQLGILLGTCAESTDPKVRGAYERYMERRTTQLLFETEATKKETDANPTSGSG